MTKMCQYCLALSSSRMNGTALQNSFNRFYFSKGDYATILLLDHRYERTKTLKQLPSWIEARVEICEKFGHAMSKLTKFFAAKQQNTKDI